jgi:hypothetical protein
MAFSRAAARSSLAWIALSMAAISRTLVEGTWVKMLRYQCTTGSLKKWPTHPLYAGISPVMALTSKPALQCAIWRPPNRLQGDPAQKKRKESGRQPLKIDGSGRQIGLDFHVGEAASYGTC